ncbi:hypothetical protein SDJN02_21905, partial [Cucurbita argyrosperma subsp. argyrosperma]|uniref:Uncharacterized protein LOC111430396 n=1 Tax=Cucurbita moschata TaxID=3662 RepID=A0A6J1E387_CUCMO
MGNSCASYRAILPCCLKVDAAHNQVEALKIVKPDGKVLGFTTPTLKPSLMDDSDKPSSTRRVRIVLTKKQLKLLVDKQVSMEELLMQQIEKTTLCSVLECSSSWKPALAAIPEGNEA